MEGECCVLYVLSRMVCFRTYFFNFYQLLCFFVNIVSVSPLFPFIFPFVILMLLATLINQIANNLPLIFFVSFCIT